MSTPEIKRWQENLFAFTEISKSANYKDDTSVLVILAKKIALARVLSKDAYNLKAINDSYLKFFDLEIGDIEVDLEEFKKSTHSSKVTEKSIKCRLDIIFGMEIRSLLIRINNHVLMLISLVNKKLKEEKEIAKQGEKLREILEEEHKAVKKITYVA